jgi:hypothetical protein
MWKVKSHALLPSALPSHNWYDFRVSSLREGQHISISVVVPPTSAALLAET